MVKFWFYQADGGEGFLTGVFWLIFGTKKAAEKAAGISPIKPN
jgi:hypothetical protein